MKIFNNLKKKLPIGISFNIVLLKKKEIDFFIIESYKLKKKEKLDLIKILNDHKINYKIYFLKILSNKNFEENFFKKNFNLIVYTKNLNLIEEKINERCLIYNNKNNRKNKNNNKLFFLLIYNIYFNGEFKDYFQIDYCKNLNNEIQLKLQKYQKIVKEINKKYTINLMIEFAN